ncbi:hypothetical protein PCANC_00277 [Puccinia coronata f. sp. avenae]|uniref:Uncharacterized protein n=1 Tax=Puccinia coronata f. sp. avenae TaxID=200324 RepID=A0A2N5W9B1_9BASI|nr:hypothetical protein PCANC_00277 [Puccinia coronata f. sp. avenae]
MPSSYSPYQEHRHPGKDAASPIHVAHHSWAGDTARPSRLSFKSPPPIPPRNYAPLPRELLTCKDHLGVWDHFESGCHQDASHSPPHLRLELERSSLRQRRLAARKLAENSSAPSPTLHHHHHHHHLDHQTTVRRCVYRRPSLILKRHSQPTPRYRTVDANSSFTPVS